MASSPATDAATSPEHPAAETESAPHALGALGSWLDGALTQAGRALIAAFKQPDAWFPGLFFPGFVLLLPYISELRHLLNLDRRFGGPFWLWGYEDNRVWWIMDSDSLPGMALLVGTVVLAARAAVVFPRRQASDPEKLPDLSHLLEMNSREWLPALPLLIARAVLSTGAFMLWYAGVRFLDVELYADDWIIAAIGLGLGSFGLVYLLALDAATQLAFVSLSVHRRGAVSALRHGVRLLRANPARSVRWIGSQGLLLFGLPPLAYQVGQFSGLGWIAQLVGVGLLGATLGILWFQAYDDLGGRIPDDFAESHGSTAEKTAPPASATP